VGTTSAGLFMALRTGSAELGLRRSEMMRLTFGAGEMCLVPRHFETWVRTDDLHYLYLSVGISDAALVAACDEQGATWNCAEWKAWLTHESVRWPRP
jgi:hypothetical protein